MHALHNSCRSLNEHNSSCSIHNLFCQPDVDPARTRTDTEVGETNLRVLNEARPRFPGGKMPFFHSASYTNENPTARAHKSLKIWGDSEFRLQSAVSLVQQRVCGLILINSHEATFNRLPLSLSLSRTAAWRIVYILVCSKFLGRARGIAGKS
jgi:hypothetical protein